MKFGKRLKGQIEQSLPGWRHSYLSYKGLKRLLRLIATVPETDFVYLLNAEIDKLNVFFIEQEEDFVIRHKELMLRTEQAMAGGWGPNWTHSSSLSIIRKDIVDFHGEMILLMNYSSINYTGLTKILKKYDKRTGGILRLPFIQKVLEQPFFKTEVISKMIKECEVIIESVFRPLKPAKKIAAAVVADIPSEGVFRNTVAALVNMHEMRRGSSTYSHFSLPPLNLPDFDAIQSLAVE